MMKTHEEIEVKQKELKKLLENYVDYHKRAKVIASLNTLDYVLGLDKNLNLDKNHESFSEDNFYHEYYRKYVSQDNSSVLEEEIEELNEKLRRINIKIQEFLNEHEYENNFYNRDLVLNLIYELRRISK